MVKTPSNFRSGKGCDTSAETRASILVVIRLAMRYTGLRCNGGIPSLTQLYVRIAKLTAKRELKVAESIESAAIDAYVLPQSLKNESSFVD